MKKTNGPGATPARRRSRWIAGAIGVSAAAACALTRVVVSGDSMRPTFEPGDRLLVLRLAHRRPLRAGMVVTVRDPRAGERRVLVKRVIAIGDGGIEVRGDNPVGSTDSREFGRVTLGEVTGRVLYRYGPPARAGVVRSSGHRPGTLEP